VSETYGLPLDPFRTVGDLSAGERQRVEIIRCLLQDPKLLIMDEPTSVLTPQEVEILFQTLRKLTAEGVAILYISHKLEEIRTLCDTATILRLGKKVATCTPADTTARALAEMKRIESSFSVAEFVHGSRAAYEMIVMGFEKGELDDIQPFIAEDVFEAFVEVVAAREDQGLTVEAEFAGVREVKLVNAEFNTDTREAQITMRYVAELTSVVRDRAGEIVEGAPNIPRRQKDTWVFARTMGKDDPNWLLVATDA
jgi:predicted lipid-binding transport protein (Tim44 family)